MDTRHILHHVTLPTGDTVTHRLDTLPAPLVDLFRPLLPFGGPVPFRPGYHVDIHERCFTLYHYGLPR